MAVACGSRTVTLAEAEKLVLAAPNIKASIAQRGATPFFEDIRTGTDSWSFTVNSRNPCAGLEFCSALLGHYIVRRSTGALWDMDANGGDGAPVPSTQLLGRRNGTCIVP